jgi:hypothetical protein
MDAIPVRISGLMPIDVKSPSRVNPAACNAMM